MGDGIVEGDIAHSNQTTQKYANEGKVLKPVKIRTMLSQLMSYK